MRFADCVTEADRRAWAVAHNRVERVAQDLEPTVTDPGTLERVARIVRLDDYRSVDDYLRGGAA